jgi:ribonuclease Z
MQWLRAVALVVSAALAIVRPATAREAAPDPVLTVTVLGSGTPVPSRTQAGSAILIQAGGQNLLFDCGRGCTTRLAELDPALVPQVKHLFLTHLHSDHITGIPDLWLNGWTLGRTAPLEIQGPKGTAEMMEHLRKAYARDIAFRLTDRMPASDSGLAPRFTDVLPRGGMIYDRRE